MPELRQNLATKEWYVIATDRAKRPEDFIGRPPERPTESRDPRCAFCSGNEHMTPPETMRITRGDAWQVRVFANKYPAFSACGSTERKVAGLYRSMKGVGVHEVIVETPKHNATVATMPLADVSDIVRAYRERYRAAIADERVALVIIFENHGPSAGSSLGHPHSQLIGTPLVPTHIRYRSEEARVYYDDVGKCVFCQMMDFERRDGERMVWESDLYVAFTPYASGAPYEVWILPKRHASSFGDTSDEEVVGFAKALKTVLAKVYHGLKDPDYNFVIRSTPKDQQSAPGFHWYVKFMPKLAQQAGFELGTGMYVNTTLPEHNAKFLRHVKLPEE